MERCSPLLYVIYRSVQGATQATVNDFWFMIWQEHPSAIIMVTQAMENGKVVRIQ